MYKISSSDYSVVETYLYRSGVQVENSQNEIVAKSNSLGSVKNYPNPFVLHGKSPVTIEFNLAKPQNVSIDLYNIKGQKVSSLMKNKFMDSGTHSFVWHPVSSLPTGAYFYKIETQKDKTIKRLLILK